MKNYPTCIELTKTGLIKTSTDFEKMCIFQAMAQSRPVLVRENQGNCSIVEDRVTGLVYKTPQVCKDY